MRRRVMHVLIMTTRLFVTPTKWANDNTHIIPLPPVGRSKSKGK